MMIDTLTVLSPEIKDKSVVENIDYKMTFKNYGIDLETGLVQYEFVKGNLEGSYDYRIAVNIIKKELRPTELMNGKIVYMNKELEHPKVKVECSPHKLILGNNILGFTDNITLIVRYLVDFLEKQFNVKLPRFCLWEIRRIDCSNCFILDNPEEYIRQLGVYISRPYTQEKKPHKYGSNDIHISSTYDCWKIYYKYPEFKKNDYTRLNKCDKILADELLEYSKKVIRIELEFKWRKLREKFGGRYPTCNEIEVEWLRSEWKLKTESILKMNLDDQIKYYSEREVFNVISSSEYSNRMKKSLYQSWLVMARHGDNELKKVLSKSQYYEHRKILRDLNIVWTNAECDIIENNNPITFIPSLDNAINIISIEAIEKLLKVA